MARLADTVDLPTPPLPDETAMIRPRFGCSIGAGGGGGATGEAPGGAWVDRAGPPGSTTEIFTSSRRTPSIAANAPRASRTSVAGSSRESRNVNEILPSSATVRSRIMPAERISASRRGLRMRASAEVTRASSESATRSSDSFHRLHLGHHLAQPNLDALLERHGRSGTSVTGPAQTQQESSILLVEVDDLHLPPVGGDVGPQHI